MIWIALVLSVAVVLLAVRGRPVRWIEEDREDRRIFSSADSPQMQLYVDDDDTVRAECPACGWVLFQGELSVPELVDASVAHRKGCVESA